MRGSNNGIVQTMHSPMSFPWHIVPPTSPIFEARTDRNYDDLYTIGPGRKTIEKRSSGISYIFVSKQRSGMQSVYQILGTIRFPFILSAYAVRFYATMTSSMLHWPIPWQRVSVNNIVPENCDFMKACDEGNYTRALDLALNGKGRPTDIDENGRPAIGVCERCLRLTKLTL